MNRRRHAFTLIEVLVSVALLSFVMLGLYGALSMQRNSNKHLFSYLTKAIEGDRVVMVLYRDLMLSDGKLTIKKGEFSRLCIENTSNSLYGLSRAKVCWLVAKEQNKLLRIEGNSYRLPLKFEDKVAVDETMEHIVLFDVVRRKEEVLVVLQGAGNEPYTFMLQGVSQPRKKPKPTPTLKRGRKGAPGKDKNSTK